MPRVMVGPGSASKRSCSRASSWRGMNFSCCATSASARPRASRAAASSWPTPVRSVILAALQRLEFPRLRKAAAQLVGVGLLGDPLAELALDAQREPERLGARRRDLVVARDELARIVHAALAVADLRQVEKRGRLVGLQAQRALEVGLGVLLLGRAFGAQRAHAGGGVRAPRRRIEGIAHRVQEIFDRRGLAPRLAQEPAVVMVDVGVVRREAQRALEALFGAACFLELHVDQAEHAVDRRVARIRGRSGAQLLERDAEVAGAVVKRSELGMQPRAVARLAHLADDAAAFRRGFRRRRAAGDQREEQPALHARTSRSAIERRVRSATSPASWPQAAAISSPRVLRVVTVRPARCRISAKRAIRSGEERLNSERGNGLNGIRLNLLLTFAATSTSSRACAGLSFTSSSITYSKVMKSRGARSR